MAEVAETYMRDGAGAGWIAAPSMSDDALGDGGLISDYKVVSWFEDAR